MSATSTGLSHLAVSLAPGTLTDGYRRQVLDFYGATLGWREIEQLRRPDRMTIAVGRSSYLNLREQHEPAAYHGYDHFGVLVRSEAELRDLWDDLDRHHPEVTLRAISEAGSTLTFRMHHLLPVAVEVQFFG